MFIQLIQHLPQLLHGLLVRLQEHGLKVHWQPVSGRTPEEETWFSHTEQCAAVLTVRENNSVPENRFNKDSESFNVNPCDEGFTEVHFQPSDEGTLQTSSRSGWQSPVDTFIYVLLPYHQTSNDPVPTSLEHEAVLKCSDLANKKKLVMKTSWFILSAMK